MNLLKYKLGNRIYYYSKCNTAHTIYNSSLKQLVTYIIDADGMCSMNRIRNIYVKDHKNKDFALKCLNDVLSRLGGVIIAITNTTKLSALNYEKAGLKLYCTLPGLYTDFGGHENYKKDNCLGIYVYTKRNTELAVETSIKLLENFNKD